VRAEPAPFPERGFLLGRLSNAGLTVPCPARARGRRPKPFTFAAIRWRVHGQPEGCERPTCSGLAAQEDASDAAVFGKCGRIRCRSTPVRLGEGFGGDDDCLEIFGHSLVAVNPAKRCSTAFRPRRDDEADPDREFLSVLGAAGEGDLDERGGSSRSLEPRNGAKYCQRRILIFRSIGSGPLTR
jgi:hypothetical protein